MNLNLNLNQRKMVYGMLARAVGASFVLGLLSGWCIERVAAAKSGDDGDAAAGEWAKNKLYELRAQTSDGVILIEDLKLYQKLVLSESRPYSLLINFGTEGKICQNCPEVLNLFKRVSASYYADHKNANAKNVFFIYIDGYYNKAIAQMHDIRSVPGVYFVGPAADSMHRDKQGNYIFHPRNRFTGMNREDSLQLLLDWSNVMTTTTVRLSYTFFELIVMFTWYVFHFQLILIDSIVRCCCNCLTGSVDVVLYRVI